MVASISFHTVVVLFTLLSISSAHINNYAYESASKRDVGAENVNATNDESNTLQNENDGTRFSCGRQTWLLWGQYVALGVVGIILIVMTSRSSNEEINAWATVRNNVLVIAFSWLIAFTHYAFPVVAVVVAVFAQWESTYRLLMMPVEEEESDAGVVSEVDTGVVRNPDLEAWAVPERTQSQAAFNQAAPQQQQQQRWCITM